MRKLLVASIALFVACDSDSGGSNTSIPASQINESIADAYCEVFTNCTFYHDDALYSAFVAASDRTACRSFFTRLIDLQFTTIEAKVQSGAITYDSAAFAACINALKSSCDLDQLDDQPSGCDAAFEGKVALGAPCENSLDCVGDARCEESFSVTDRCVTSLCVARVARGEACDFNGDCSQSAGPTTCTSASDICVPFTTEANIAEGARCDEAFNANSVTRRTCATGLFCLDNTNDEDPDQAFCRKPFAQGSDCSDSDLPCAKGLFCLASTGTDAETCQPLPIVRTVGADCNVNSAAGPLAICSMFEQLGCDSGKCKKWGDGTAGAYCDVPLDDTEFSCDRGLFCTATSTCATQKAVGAACEDWNECLDGYCDSSSDQTGVCVSAVSPVCS